MHDELSATDWVVDQLHLTQSRGDMAVLAQAIPAWQQHNTARLGGTGFVVHQALIDSCFQAFGVGEAADRQRR